MITKTLRRNPETDLRELNVLGKKMFAEFIDDSLIIYDKNKEKVVTIKKNTNINYLQGIINQKNLSENQRAAIRIGIDLLEEENKITNRKFVRNPIKKDFLDIESTYRKFNKKDALQLSETEKLSSGTRSSEIKKPYIGQFIEGVFYIDGYWENSSVYISKYINPKTLLDNLNFEWFTYQDIVNQRTTQQYIKFYLDGYMPPPIIVIIDDNGNLKSINRRRVVAAIEAGIKLIPANVEIGRLSDFEKNNSIKNTLKEKGGKMNKNPSDEEEFFNLEVEHHKEDIDNLILDITRDIMRYEFVGMGSSEYVEKVKKGLIVYLQGD